MDRSPLGGLRESRSRSGRSESTKRELPGNGALVARGVPTDSNRRVAAEIATLEEAEYPAVGRRGGAIRVRVAPEMAEAVADFGAGSTARSDSAGRVAIDEVDGRVAGAVASAATERDRDEGCQRETHGGKTSRLAIVRRRRPGLSVSRATIATRGPSSALLAQFESLD